MVEKAVFRLRMSEWGIIRDHLSIQITHNDRNIIFRKPLLNYLKLFVERILLHYIEALCYTIAILLNLDRNIPIEVLAQKCTLRKPSVTIQRVYYHFALQSTKAQLHKAEFYHRSLLRPRKSSIYRWNSHSNWRKRPLWERKTSRLGGPAKE